MSDEITVFLVDDHELVRRGVAELLDAEPGIRVVGEAGSIEQARGRIGATAPAIALLDVRLPDGSGIDLCRELRTRMPAVRCVMLTAYDDDEAMIAAVIADAAGYVLKDIRGSGLVEVLRRVATGRSALDPALVRAVRARLRNASSGDPRLASLNPREREVLALIADGLSNRQIGNRLALTEKTVKNYVSSMLAKLGLQSRTQAAVLHLETRRARPLTAR
ncbi:response regulator [Amnibacterium kyonggiense]|uniref:LuxR family two component transcriptional regulator n=1 Tax=Amnibacterium kyonggiense TaxID=595671 RepID=A0A4R7FKG7_9MICO|nr:response regulator transcription factor [Amnibacterium kyonggiense]TDS76845.1 LuxR family two component transcriptional regulator [Amnibacterium kyonggiense]